MREVYRKDVGNREAYRKDVGSNFLLTKKTNSDLAVKCIVLLPSILVTSECNHNRFSHKKIKSLPMILSSKTSYLNDSF